MSNFYGISKMVAFENLKDTLERLGIMENRWSGRVHTIPTQPLTPEILEEAAKKAMENFGKP